MTADRLLERNTAQTTFNPLSKIEWNFNRALKVCENSGANNNILEEIEAWAYMQSIDIANLTSRYTTQTVNNYFRNKLIEKNGHINWNRVKYYIKNKKGK